MRTVDPATWLRGSVPGWRTHRQTDVHLETRLRRSLRDAVLEFFQYSSMRGHLIANRRCVTTCDAFRNFLGSVTVFSIAMMLVTFNLQQQLSRPSLEVNAEFAYTVTKLPFPGVAICTNNVISMKSLQEYRMFLWSEAAQADKNRSDKIDILMNNILNFGAFLSKSLPQVDMEHSFNNADFNVSDVMYKLSPKCSELLKTCAWEGSLMNCSDLFASRITPLGFCCVFNARYQLEDQNTPVWGSLQVGQSTGLTVIYTEDDEDSAYMRRPALGVEVLVFDGEEYPLLETGVARLFPVQRNCSMFFSLIRRDIRASRDLTFYSERFRKCRFRNLHGPRSARSSYGWCLLECRKRTIAALCNCVPFNLMPDEDDIICTPKHLPCLNKHKEKFIYYYPGENAGPGLTQEIQDSLSCGDCLPDCGRMVYTADVAITSHSLSFEKKFVRGLVYKPGATLANSSILRFFYTTNHQPLFIVEPALRWYEGIAYLSSQWVLLLSVTLVTIVEIIFHLTVRWVHHFRRRTVLVRTHTKLVKAPSNSEELQDIPVTCFEETKQVNITDIPEPPVKRFYF
ncbi:sodium channel protein Nach-like [Plodia interpunctella]|uniref:sodium channel protein Nach-like n=1 Tax=Plodia interpunctella TaxID=58824 RepID=UPI0023688BE5|nr:sodium channel protein Nach-like [Plodia interpunctella]